MGKSMMATVTGAACCDLLYWDSQEGMDDLDYRHYSRISNQDETTRKG